MGDRLRQDPLRHTTVLLSSREQARFQNGDGEALSNFYLIAAANTPFSAAAIWLWYVRNQAALLNAMQSATASASPTHGLNGLYRVSQPTCLSPLVFKI